MKNQLKVFRILVLFMFAGAEGRLHAATVIDQEQPAIDIRVGGLEIGGNSQQNLAQVVTAGVSGFLTEARFPISCYSADLIVEIHGLTNGTPDSIILNSQTFAG